MILCLTFLCLAFVLVSGQKGCTCGVNRYTTRIVNGVPSKQGAHPWLAKLRIIEIYQDRTVPKACGAAFINTEWLLTAAHCLETGDRGEKPLAVARYVQFGVNDVSNWNEEKVLTLNKKRMPLDRMSARLGPNIRRVDKAIPHEEWDDIAIVNDIALLHISQPVEFTKEFSPVCLPEKDIGPFSNLVVAGWGKTGDKEDPSDILLEAAIEENDSCMWYNKTHQVCASKGDKRTCQGDSGGPLMTNRRGRVYQVGVVSYGPFSCHEIEEADTYAKVSYYNDWIKGHAITGTWCRP